MAGLVGEGAPQFLTVAEVAELMRVSKMTVYRLIHSAELPAIRVGKSFRVPTRAVDQYIDQGMIEGAEVTHFTRRTGS